VFASKTRREHGILSNILHPKPICLAAMPILDETIQPLVGDIENDEENTESTGTFVERPHFALSQVTQCYSFSAKLSRFAR